MRRACAAAAFGCVRRAATARSDAAAAAAGFATAGGDGRKAEPARGGAKAKAASSSGAGKEVELLTEYVATPPPPPPPPHTAADAARAKEYSRLKMAEHRQLQADLSRKLRLMHAAVAALPQELQAAAMAPDLSFIPAKRGVPLETPPQPQWYAEKLRDAERAAGGGR